VKDYTQVVTDNIRLKHGSQVRFTVTSGRQTLDDRLTDVELVGAAMTTTSFIYNRLSMSGGVSWWNPSTGASIAKPKVQLRVRPQDVLTGDQLCDCARCAS
jgi:cold shock CspA family protein